MNAQNQTTGNGKSQLATNMELCGFTSQNNNDGSWTVMDETGTPAYAYIEAEERWVSLANTRLHSATVIKEIESRLAGIALAKMASMAHVPVPPPVHTPAPAPSATYQPVAEPAPGPTGPQFDTRGPNQKFPFRGRVEKGVCYKCGGHGVIQAHIHRDNGTCYACLGTGRFIKKADWNVQAERMGFRKPRGNRRPDNQTYRPNYGPAAHGYPQVPGYHPDRNNW